MGVAIGLDNTHGLVPILDLNCIFETDTADVAVDRPDNRLRAAPHKEDEIGK